MEKKKKFEKTRHQKRLKKREQDFNEWESLQREENLFKKLRKGKISQADYDKLLEGEDIDESD